MHRFIMVRIGAVFLLLCGSVLNSGAGKAKYSFEDDQFEGWTVQGKGWSVYPKAGSDGKKSAMCLIPKKEKPGLKACAREISKADVGWVVKIDADIAGKAKSQSSRASIVLMCVDKKGTTIHEVKKEISKPETKFKKVSLPEVIIPSGTVKTYLMLMVEVTKESGAKEWWRFDNVSVEVK